MLTPFRKAQWKPVQNNLPLIKTPETQRDTDRREPRGLSRVSHFLFHVQQSCLWQRYQAEQLSSIIHNQFEQAPLNYTKDCCSEWTLIGAMDFFVGIKAWQTESSLLGLTGRRQSWCPGCWSAVEVLHRPTAAGWPALPGNRGGPGPPGPSLWNRDIREETSEKDFHVHFCHWKRECGQLIAQWMEVKIKVLTDNTSRTKVHIQRYKPTTTRDCKVTSISLSQQILNPVNRNLIAEQFCVLSDSVNRALSLEAGDAVFDSLWCSTAGAGWVGGLGGVGAGLGEARIVFILRGSDDIIGLALQAYV